MSREKTADQSEQKKKRQNTNVSHNEVDQKLN